MLKENTDCGVISMYSCWVILALRSHSSLSTALSRFTFFLVVPELLFSNTKLSDMLRRLDKELFILLGKVLLLWG